MFFSKTAIIIIFHLLLTIPVLASPPPPTNDDCANAINVVVNGPVISGITQQASLEPGEIIDCAPVLVTQSVWYYFTATAANISVSLTSTAGACYFSSSIWGASNGCPASTGCHPLSCQSASFGPNTSAHVLTNLTIGANYYIQILYTSGSGGCGASAGFDVSVSTTIPANPSNPPPVSTCSTPTGPICVLNFIPGTYAQIAANCTLYNNPAAANNNNEVYQACFSFTAQNSSNIDFQMASTSTCTGFFVWFNWELFNSSCSSIDCGTFPDMSSSGLTCGNNYELCISYEIPDPCVYTSIIPYITAVQPILNVTAAAGNSLIICSGSSTSLIANATGYVAYQWTPSTGLSATTGSTVTANPTITTVYSVTGFDAGGCTQTATVNVIVRPIPNINLSGTVNTSCGNANGIINNTTNGGGAPYTFLWNTGSTFEDLSGLLAGTYTVTATNSFGCTSSASFTINNVGNFTATFTQVNNTCTGGTSGSINVTVPPCAPYCPYIYLWNTGAVTQDLVNILSGNYSITVTNGVGCTSVLNPVITSFSPPIILSFTNTGVTCFGGATGNIDMSVSGGNPNYAYVWSNGVITEDNPNVFAGTYAITVYDLLGCSTISNTTVTQFPPISFSSIATNITCGSSANGAVDISISGGNPLYIFNWSDGQTTEDAVGLSAGPISVNILDQSGCFYTWNTIITGGSSPAISSITTYSSCLGNINLSVAGGTAPYNYLWNTTATTQDISGLTGGSYSVTVTDANICTQSLSVIIAAPNTNVVTLVSVNPTCGANDGEAEVNAISGGGGPFTYLWNNGGTDFEIVNLSAGTYSVTVTNSFGCTSTTSNTLVSPNGPSLSFMQNNVVCNGSSTGSINMTVTGGTGPFLYNWSNNSVVQDPTNLSAGAYNVSVTDANNCVVTGSVVITQNAATVLSQTSVNSTCSLGNGSVDLTAVGNGPFTYLWNNASTDQDLPFVGAGNYSVTVTDINNCTSTLSFVVNNTPGPSSLSFNPTPVFCNGAATGIIDLTVIGGIPPFTYAWNNGATTQDISGLTANTYTVNVTDANNCVVGSGIIISQPAANVISETHVNATCGLSNGSINLSVAGPNPPFTYLWSNAEITQDISILIAGAYTVTVTDFNSCTSTLTVNISNTSGPVLSETHVDVLCNGNNSGSINLSVVGGTTPYNYIWSNGSIIQDPPNLIAGNYIVTVTDFNNCQSTLTINISEPTAIALSETHIDASCGTANGSINLTVVGGTSPYTFFWSNTAISEDINSIPAGTYTVTVADFNNCTTTLTANISNTIGPTLSETHVDVLCNGNNTGSINLSVVGGTTPYNYIWSNGSIIQDPPNLIAGNYTVTVTDFNNCQSTLTITISEPTAISISETHVDASCGTSNGSINISVVGGTSPYTYLWSNAAITEDLLNIPAGAYTVTTTDFNSCTSTLTANISNTSGPVLSETHVDVLCNGNNTGSINLSVVGGQTPYNYIWSNAATTANISTLVANNYTVTVTDFNNCQSTLTITISEPTLITISETHVDASCGTANGSINLLVVGGTSPYTFIWSNAATTANISLLTANNYSVTVIDFNSCTSALIINIQNGIGPNLSETHVNSTCGNANGAINLSVVGGQNPYTYSWSNGSVFQDLVFLNGGNYSVTVTDNNNCTSSLSISITGSTALVLQSVVNEVTCFGFNDGAIDLTVNGGTAPYIYDWSTNATTQDLSGISGGNYTITVTDFIGCTTDETINVVEHAQLTPSQTHVNETCGQSNGSINLNTVGGYFPYTFLWSTNAVTQNLTGITAGNYSVTVTDFNLCTAVLNVVVTGTSGPTAQFANTNLLCNGSASGAINLTVVGGTLPYTYLWNTNSTNQDINNLSAGNYIVTITDANNCTGTGNTNITQPSALQLSETHVNASCGTSNGAIDLTVIGGTTPYSFIWSNAAITQNLTSLAIGTYDVTVTDFNNCTSTLSINIINGGGTLSLSFISTNETCSAANGAIDLSVNAGTAPYNFIWSNAAITEDLNLISAATYDVTVNDAGGCSATISVIISNTPSPQLSVTHVDETCGNANGSIDLTVAGGTLPINYLWSNASINEDLTSLAANNYTITVTDASNCTATLTVQILNSASPVINQTHADENCNQANGSVDLTISNGALPINFSWSNGAVTEDLTNLAAGNYSVTVTDANGCSASQTILLTNIAGPLLIEVHISTSCGLNNGSIDLTVIGGVAPFNYLWSNGALTQDLQNLAANTFDVTVTDAGGCTAALSGIVINTSTSIQVSETHTSSTCGNANAGIDITASSGSAPYNYLWNNNTVSEDLTAVLSGNYSVTVTDNAGCTASINISVIDFAGPQLIITPTATSCGNNDGTIDLTVNGGTAAFNYLWSNGEISEDVLSLQGGNYIVTVTDANGCTASISTDVIASTYPLLSVSISGNNGCIPLTVLFTNMSTNSVSYTWIFGDGSTSNSVSPSYQYNQVGIFPVILIATSTTGCMDTLVVDTVSIYETPIANFTSAPWMDATTLLSLADFQFINQSVFAATYFWSFGDENYSADMNPNHIYSEAGEYMVTLYAYNENGCADTVSYGPFIMIADGEIFIPNTFTPNGDNWNDFFKVYGTGIDNVSMQIFDRWGEMIFDGNGTSPQWDGSYHNTKLNTGVYVYQISVIRYNGLVIRKTGDVTLLR